MGKLENEARYERRKGYLQQALLAAVAIPGLLLVATAAPNVLQLIERLPGNKYKFNYRMKSVASRLAQRKLVRFVERNGRKYMEITEAGRQVLEMEQQKRTFEKRSRRRWDKRWRMIIFDIPEKYRATRSRLRVMLRSLGFVQLQGSVWVYPHDCEEVIALLKSELRVGASVLYTIVEKIENDAALKDHFGLR
ncbi:hypothetical protein A3H16_03445 [Candidatus Kaiserbacteria bacterium RIFCSPLOWO2_12_FULL_53_8]|uniref:Transcriptional repressor PaaX-like central Cas2-like domain-containing protein n=2 Tax=Candidatus Kaiseribacteriota TaxID=1752734 RepID=A0A1F6CUQ6_9BACT|nr:MAG: hypothetical protein A2851_04365 [Candidatus Kaiserbacteria bacterium RIFCSPHIGHO2_01_FULL_53_29]OGG91510.1 MAG: hypothetical protein A3H16_03445 [Candidatus Kaiserbacteria bacterium RIFCSPLOWO2_12_FULL_53_8]